MGAAFLRCGPREPVPGVPGATSCPAAPGPGPAQAGRDRSDVTVRRLSPVRRHIATVTAAAARPGTGQRTGPRRRLRPVRHPGNRRPGRALIRQRSLQKSRTLVTLRRLRAGLPGWFRMTDGAAGVGVPVGDRFITGRGLWVLWGG